MVGKKKRCDICYIIQPLESFRTLPKGRLVRETCLECRRTQKLANKAKTRREWRKGNPEPDRAALRRSYRKNGAKQIAHRAKKRDEEPLTFMLYSAKARAKKRGIPYDLVPEDLLPLPTHCPVLGFEMNYKAGNKQRDGRSASLDRIIPSLGYTKGNVVIISDRANMLKRDGTLEEIEAVGRWLRGVVTPVSKHGEE